MRRAALLVVAACACGSRAQPAELAAYLSNEPDVADWRLDRASWDATVIPAYAPLYDDYTRAFDAAAPALAAQLATRGVPRVIATRPHYAGDPKLTADQSVIRWALPTLYPSQVAMLDDHPIDAVFVRVGERWRAIVGMRDAIQARVRVFEPACTAFFDPRPEGTRQLPKACRDAIWPIADGALKSLPERVHTACNLAATLCAGAR